MATNEKDSSEKPESQQSIDAADGQVLEVANAEYALALSTGPQLSAYSWRSIQLFGILLIAYMGSLSNGFDGSGEVHNRPNERV